MGGRVAWNVVRQSSGRAHGAGAIGPGDRGSRIFFLALNTGNRNSHLHEVCPRVFCLVLLLVSCAGCVNPPPGLPNLPGGPGNTTTVPTGVSTSALGTPDTPGMTATTGTAVVTTLPAPSTTPGAEPPSTVLPLILIGIVGVVALVGIGWMMTRRTAPADD